MCVHAHVHTRACVCQRTTLSDVLRDTVNSLEIGFSQAWSTGIKLASKFQEPSCLCLHTAGTTSVYHYAQHRVWVLGVDFRPLYLGGSVSEHLPSRCEALGIISDTQETNLSL